MIVPFEVASSDALYRLILDNALDAFIAIDNNSRIIEWSRQAEKMFGWLKQEVIGEPLTNAIIPEKYGAAHMQGLRHFLESGEEQILGHPVEFSARRKDGSEFPVELIVTPIPMTGCMIFSASIRNIAQRQEMEEKVRQQEHLTKSILDSMAEAVVVVDTNGRILLVNPSAQQMFDLRPADIRPDQSFLHVPLFQSDGKTPCGDSERPMLRVLRGEDVTRMICAVHRDQAGKNIWVSVNAAPLKRGNAVIGAVLAFRDITDLQRGKEALAVQTQLLQEQASLLDLTHDAIIVRNPLGSITYWNKSAERLYGYGQAEALGQTAYQLLATEFTQPVENILNAMRETQYWEGDLVQVAKDGRRLHVFSQWVMELRDGEPLRYLQTDTDVTARVHAERALQESQENYQMQVEASTGYAIFMVDPHGTILSWSSGAEKIMGLKPQDAIGQPFDRLFTPEDREIGAPRLELDDAKEKGHAENERWHVKHDGTRFWASGIVTPLWNNDGKLRGFVKIMRDYTEQRLAEEQTQFLANHDQLTGLPNRVSFSSQLHKSIARSERTRSAFAVLLLDLDKFKQINDTLGHHAGDLLLKEVALRILATLRETDFVARMGGDEFIVIQTDVSQPDASDTLARKLILELGRPYRIDGSEVFSGASIGVSVYPNDAQNSVELIKRADLALYRAKNGGRCTYQFYTPDLFRERAWRKNREEALRGALKNHEFTLYYQPQIDLGKWKIATVEVLLRWQANGIEMVLPNDFLLVAEETGLIIEIGKWTLRQACEQVKKWQSQGLSELRVSFNCSARQFGDPEFVKQIRPILEETGLDPCFLELEINESMLAEHPEIKEQLSMLRSHGVRVTIDNYGTGTTSLIDLKEFAVDSLKIDKAFVQHLPHRRKDSAITSAIIDLAHNLGIGVSAGGVETAEQLAYLRSRNCTNAQGFIFSPPLPAQEFEELMLSGTWSRMNRAPAVQDGTATNGIH